MSDDPSKISKEQSLDKKTNIAPSFRRFSKPGEVFIPIGQEGEAIMDHHFSSAGENRARPVETSVFDSVEVS